ncbi:MAG TPA: alpha/beta hydrolase [Candidatus Dormibacteraeota bacterium]|nr:alpha/beta hydrolase [Candidatus Dormibacteraeota bacterium]
MKRVAIVAAIVVVAVSACTRGAGFAKFSPPSTPKADKIAWSSCGGGFQCGSLTVPLDYSNPNGDTIKIALIRKPATDSAHRIGSLLTNPGGPGASGIDYLKSSASSLRNLNVRFDLIGFDPRGTGQSSPIRCLTGPQEDAFNALDSVLDDPVEKAAAIQADKDFVAGCQQMSGKLLPYVDTPSVARDMDRIRAALGDTKLSYLGFSYGSFLGEWYAHLFPSHVRALALDGVLDPALPANDFLLQQIKGLQSNLDAFAADCKTKSTCQLGRSGDPVSKMVNLLNQLDNHPMQVGGRQLTRALALYGIGVTLYDQTTWPYLDQAVSTALAGNGQLLLRFSDVYLGRQADGSYDTETDSNIAINCLDHQVPTDIASYDALGPSFAAASPVFGAAFQYGNLICAYWPVPAKVPPGALSVDGSPPILLVGGLDDPITPYAWAQGAAKEMKDSVLLTRRGYGHTSYGSSTCAQAATDAYLLELRLPATGTICTS